VALEGFNGTLTGPAKGIRAFCDALRVFSPEHFGSTDYKFVDGLPDNKMFRALKVWPVEELVTYGFSVDQAPLSAGGKHVSPQEWTELASRPDTVMIDVRNAISNILDRYILAKSAQMVERVTDDLDAYDLFSACSGVRDFLDVLTNWYIRRSRDRFWEGDQDAIDTLHTVLEILCRVSAPMLPLLSDTIYSGLIGDRSVHLTDWPTTADLPNDVELVRAMDRVREVCSVALSIRKAHSRRVRLPLSELVVSHPDSSELASFIDIIADEVNVKKVTLATEISGAASAVLQVLPGALGPRLGGRTQDVIKAVKAGNWRQDGEQVFAGDIELFAGEYNLKMVAAE
jgi:isoleucyl-tRNA synthetase